MRRKVKRMISLQRFKDYKGLLEDTITNKAFRSRMMFEAIEDETFADNVISFISRLSKDISSEELDKVLSEIRELTIIYIEKSKALIDFSEKMKNGLRSLAYFYFLESIDEHSIISDNIIEKIKNKYQNNYLDIIAEIDKVYLSVHTKKKVLLSGNNLEIDDDLLNKYIILKQWQDKQHLFFEKGYGKYLEKLQYQYCEDRSLDSFDLEQLTLRKRLFDGLSKKKILDIDTCSILSELYIKKFVVKYIGGKMYGLSVLNSNGIKIPYSMVVPTEVSLTKEDLQKIDSKYGYYSVRSSADIEDGENNSFAGMFDSYLNIPKTDILDNIKKVKQSVNNTRLKEYIRVNSLEQPHMAVVIQSFKEPSYAGVWIGNSETSGVLEWVSGNGEKLVSGSSIPHIEIWNSNECSNPLECGNLKVGQVMLEYQNKVGCNADFEWMILDEQLVMLQFRPVTKKVIIDESYNDRQISGYSGIPASSGIVDGEVRYLESPEEKIEPNKILLAMTTDPSWLPHLMSSKGVVTAYGGFLCHTAIVCRELGIPCVTGVGEDTLDEIIKSEIKNIEIKGNSGTVRMLDKKKMGA